jgi:hypothetical protein
MVLPSIDHGDGPVVALRRQDCGDSPVHATASKAIDEMKDGQIEV